MRYCEAGRTPYNPRSVQRVIAEMEECYNEHGIREIDIFDTIEIDQIQRQRETGDPIGVLAERVYGVDPAAVEAACEIARATSPDDCNGLADPVTS